MGFAERITEGTIKVAIIVFFVMFISALYLIPRIESQMFHFNASSDILAVPMLVQAGLVGIVSAAIIVIVGALFYQNIPDTL